jgi:hypothetical protein
MHTSNVLVPEQFGFRQAISIENATIKEQLKVVHILPYRQGKGRGEASENFFQTMKL